MATELNTTRAATAATPKSLRAQGSGFDKPYNPMRQTRVQRHSFIADVAEPCIDVPGRPHGVGAALVI